MKKTGSAFHRKMRSSALHVFPKNPVFPVFLHIKKKKYYLPIYFFKKICMHGYFFVYIERNGNLLFQRVYVFQSLNFNKGGLRWMI